MRTPKHRVITDQHGLMSRMLRFFSRLLFSLAYYLSAAIVLPYSIHVFIVESGSFSRLPVVIAVACLCVVTFFLYHTDIYRIRFRVSWVSSIVLVVLLLVMGLAFAAVLSVMIVTYLCQAVDQIWKLRKRPPIAVSNSYGLVLVVTLVLVIFPVLNMLWYRGALVSYWSFAHMRQNFFYDINRDGYRGELLDVRRGAQPRLLFMGDSTTHGHPYRYKEAFPHLVKARLEKMGLPNVEIINAGTVGQSLSQIHRELLFFLQYDPDIIFMMVGIHYKRISEDAERIDPTQVRDASFRPMWGIPILVQLFYYSVGTGPLWAWLRKDTNADFDLHRQAYQLELKRVISTVVRAGVPLYFIEYPTPAADRRTQTDIETIAKEAGVGFIRLSDKYGAEFSVTAKNDRIHPDRRGHQLIADEVATVAHKELRKNLGGTKPH